MRKCRAFADPARLYGFVGNPGHIIELLELCLAPGGGGYVCNADDKVGRLMTGNTNDEREKD